MIRTIKLFLTGLVLSMLLITCDKEYSLEGDGTNSGGNGTSGGTATYTLSGAPGSCPIPSINGTYKAGTALDASNTIILAVDVSAIGTYTVSTNTRNGITFTGAGTFTVTGTQILVLTGSGTPTAEGIFNFVAGSNGCSFPLTVTGAIAAPVAVGTLNCPGATLAGVYTQGVALTSANKVTIPVTVTTAGTYSVTITATNGCSFTGSGTLAVGAQSIVLTGSGIPVNAGPFAYPITLGTSNCSFSITFLPGIPPAVGTLDCASATLAGTYTQGIALGASNTITIPVTVTTAGPYSINTTATNGVTFTGTGTLAMGNQTVVLTGSGTPTNAGNISIPVSFGTSSCNVSITFIAGSTSADFLKCSVDGSAITNFNTNLSGSLAAGSFEVDGDSPTQSLQISVINSSGGAITVGTYNNASPTNTDIYCDDQLTNIGSLTPIWSDLSITSNIFTVNITSVTATVVTGTFSGTMTDISGSGGGTKVITNGSFSITY